MRVRGSRMEPFRRGFNRPRASPGDFDTALRWRPRHWLLRWITFPFAPTNAPAMWARLNTSKLGIAKRSLERETQRHATDRIQDTSSSQKGIITCLPPRPPHLLAHRLLIDPEHRPALGAVRLRTSRRARVSPPSVAARAGGGLRLQAGTSRQRRRGWPAARRLAALRAAWLVTGHRFSSLPRTPLAGPLTNDAESARALLSAAVERVRASSWRPTSIQARLGYTHRSRRGHCRRAGASRIRLISLRVRITSVLAVGATGAAPVGDQEGRPPRRRGARGGI